MSAEHQSDPSHVAVIMDGNGRWAQAQGLPRAAGHKKGVETIRALLPLCLKRKISYLTLFAFSSENWRRPPSEVRLLIELLTSTLESEMKRLHENQIRLRVIGDVTEFPQRLQKRIAEAVELTSQNNRLHLTMAINYGGHWDIAAACQDVVKAVKNGALEPDDIVPEHIESHLSTSDLPNPDLFIRTGGEKRISNFLLWQLAYTELIFLDTHWPDFDEQCFNQALAEFSNRQRRYGMTGDQIGGSS